jgi:Na+-transporting NADH:ubiquinone oxidoreductase subunit F
MLKTQFTLISKSLLTHDVYELIYSCPDMTKEYPKPWQYVMFQLAPGLGRAYSIASFEWETFTLIIKRIPEGRGSPLICDAEIGAIFSGMLPLGHFVLQDNSKNKCFIGTGTGFAPVYCQALGHSMREEKATKVAFVFWVRNLEDSFYEEEIMSLGKDFESFEYVQYFSRESELPTILPTDYPTNRLSGYVTDWITPEHIESYQEFYLCGSPAMVKSAREKLEALGITKEKIFWEQF